jgi:hypothetical protein
MTPAIIGGHCSQLVVRISHPHHVMMMMIMTFMVWDCLEYCPSFQEAAAHNTWWGLILNPDDQIIIFIFLLAMIQPSIGWHVLAVLGRKHATLCRYSNEKNLFVVLVLVILQGEFAAWTISMWGHARHGKVCAIIHDSFFIQSPCQALFSSWTKWGYGLCISDQWLIYVPFSARKKNGNFTKVKFH